MVVGKARKKWESGKYVIYFDGIFLGQVAISGDLASGSEPIMVGLVPDVTSWLEGWKVGGETPWTFIVRDNRGDRWLKIEAFMLGITVSWSPPGSKYKLLVKSSGEIDPLEEGIDLS